MYNWGWWAMGTGGGVNIDIIGNKFKAGPNSNVDRGEVQWRSDWNGENYGPPGDPSIFIQGNIGHRQNDPDGDNWIMVEESPVWRPAGHSPDQSFQRFTQLSSLVFPITVNSVLDIEDILLPDVGASKRLDENGNWLSNRDAVDLRLIQEYRDGTGQIPYDENSVGGYPTIAPGTPYIDTDHDAMPDAWETAHGFNPNDVSDGNGDADGDGYTNVEEFLNGITSGPIGDVTGDSQVNIQDIQACVNHILGTQDWGALADVNGDEAVNVLDVQAIVNIILSS